MSPWLYLIVSLWGAWFTYNVHRPHWKHPRFATFSFASGWLTSELALHHIGWQALATAIFAWAGAFEAWPGWVGLGITGASWAGLTVAHIQASRTGEIVEAALRAGLGSDYALEIEPSLRDSFVSSIDWRRIALPFPIRSRQVERIRDIQYARAAAVDLKLDVYRSRQPLERAPVLFQVHGGGWVMGSKDEQALPLMTQLAQHGWVCVAANYRLSPHATFPEHLIDLKRALSWIKQHIEEYGGDPDFVVVTGGSAGGHLAALVALTQNDPEYQPGFEADDTSVRGCVPFYGVYDLMDRNATHRNRGLADILERQIMKGSRDEIPEAWDRASPIGRIHEAAPPFMAVHGSADTLVPVGEAREFTSALAEKSHEPVVYVELPGTQHAFELFPSVRTHHVTNGVERFLAHLYSRYRRAHK